MARPRKRARRAADRPAYTRAVDLPDPGAVPPTAEDRTRRGVLLTTIASKTDPTKEYKIYREADGRLLCTCPDFLSRRRARGTWCKHLEQLHRTHGLRDLRPDEAPRSRVDVIHARGLLIDIAPSTPSVGRSRHAEARDRRDHQ